MSSIPGYDFWLEPEDEDERLSETACVIEGEIYADSERIKDIARDAMCDLEETTYCEMAYAFYQLNKKEPSDLLGSSVIQSLYQIAKIIAGEVDKEVKLLSIAQAETESKSWPKWRGTDEATKYHAQITGATYANP